MNQISDESTSLVSGTINPTALPSLTGRFWIEKCHVAGRTDRMGGANALGSALWSPQRSENGADIYSTMREVQAGDAVLHLTDNSAFTGVSIAAAAVDDSFIGLDGTDWEKAKAYRVQLTGFEKLDPPIRREAFLGDTVHKDVLLGILSRHSKLFFNRTLELNQGAYLTSAPKELVDFINGLYRQIAGRDLPYVSTRTQADPIPNPPSGRARFWAIAAGEAGKLWNEFQELGIAAIGWDRLGDLRAYPSQAEALKALVAVQGGNPTNDALCLYQFAHEIQTGDYVVSKSGRSRVLGIGVITSAYRHDPERNEYQNIRNVRWLSSEPLDLPDKLRLSVKTLTDVTPYADFVAFIRENYLDASKAEAPVITRPFSSALAAQELFMDVEQIDSILTTWRRKKNLVLQGPPGVGKTFAAKLLSYALMGEEDPSRVEMIQFHQSYSYEDFVQGWRPTTDGGFKLKEGIFYEVCSRARVAANRDHVLVIDEMNRGNLSRIFGELMMLIEHDKRGSKYAIPLTYSERGGERFSVPDNLYILGLMNTADRSLALIDYALRRRFSFIKLEPQFENARFVEMLSAAGADAELIGRITKRLSALNADIAKDKEFGPGFCVGHSYFCPTPGAVPDGRWFEEIVRTEIEPLLDEYWFDDQARKDRAIQELIS